MSRNRLLVFVDCNVLIESLFIPMHPASAVAVLSANKQIDLITCSLVVDDVEKEVLERATEKNDFGMIIVSKKLGPLKEEARSTNKVFRITLTDNSGKPLQHYIIEIAVPAQLVVRYKWLNNSS